MLCEFGCEKEANFQLKNKKWCCSKSSNSCPAFREKLSNARKGKYAKENHPLWGKKFSEESRKRMSNSHIGKPNSMKGKTFSEEVKKNMSISHKGQIVWNKGLKTGPLTEETKNKLSIANKGRNVPDHVRELHRHRMKNGGAKHASSFITEESKEKQRQRMLNGQASFMNKCIKNPSKPETNLRNIVKELYPECEFQYQILNYAIDVAIPKYKIAIEYDGYYHFCSNDAIIYHNNRQKKIELEGWTFIRYNIYNSFPTKDVIKIDIENIINKEVLNAISD